MTKLRVIQQRDKILHGGSHGKVVTIYQIDHLRNNVDILDGKIPHFLIANFHRHEHRRTNTVKGAQASSIIYSLAETAKLNNLNIYAYLETVLLYMPDYKDEPEGIEELMPWSEMIQQRCRIKSKS